MKPGDITEVDGKKYVAEGEVFECDGCFTFPGSDICQKLPWCKHIIFKEYKPTEEDKK